MKIKKFKPRTQVREGAKHGIKLGDGTFHRPEHVKLGLFVGLWNGEKTQCRVVNVKILDTENSRHSHPWWKPYVGEVIQAIEIFYYGDTFAISNSDGSGMQKITVGQGMWTAGHASLESYEVIEVLHDMKQWVMEFDFEKSAEIAKAGEAYWSRVDPAHYEAIKKLREEVASINRAMKNGTLKIGVMGNPDTLDVRPLDNADFKTVGRKDEVTSRVTKLFPKKQDGEE